MKKSVEKKLHLGKIKVANFSSPVLQGNALLQTANTCSTVCSFRICDANTSQTAPVCSVDSCRY
ncbi:hypothetical protein COR50_19605 [Chitinophaga caeni]|uniref:Lantibiotic n=1 Tax=Chitinophaga caeni TaxID=2029983 RepID=A0A291QZ65_9BACT|nr:hypothetical protein [Chitinophaga caeni]ATL49201.1 hypothetical protein COR50_19605 [Chitinophaga caeni]